MSESQTSLLERLVTLKIELPKKFTHARSLRAQALAWPLARPLARPPDIGFHWKNKQHWKNKDAANIEPIVVENSLFRPGEQFGIKTKEYFEMHQRGWPQ